ncbi:hypothetical protein ACFYWX_42860 [Streptomyces sp. NPDC002888]|uniref:hypothetical protein n=1 Tax=Streptomyces sp. NPDC002888 TaxID=3364668 RepID=UPI003683B9E9
MHDLIRRTLEWMRLLLGPGTGKRRRTHRHLRPHVCLHFTAVRHYSTPLPPHRSPYGLATPLDGTDSALVRPYLMVGAQEVAA